MCSDPKFQPTLKVKNSPQPNPQNLWLNRSLMRDQAMHGIQIIPGRKIHLENSIGNQKISQGEDTNSDVLDQPKEWQILQSHNTTYAMFQYKNQLQDYLEESYANSKTNYLHFFFIFQTGSLNSGFCDQKSLPKMG